MAGIDEPIRELERLYADADRRLRALIGAAADRGATGTARFYENQRRAVQAILAQLRAQAVPLAGASAASSYFAGAAAVDRLIRPAKAYSGVHEAAARVLAINIERTLEGATQFIGRQADDVFREVGLREVAAGVISGEGPQAISKRIRNDLVAEGLTAFKDRRGRRISLETYSTMVARTTSREAVTLGTINRLSEIEFDLVTVSSHANSCPICLPYQGKTYSISGRDPDHPKLAERPPFHPNCRHVLTPASIPFEEMERELQEGPPVNLDSPEQTPSARVADSFDVNPRAQVAGPARRVTDAIDEVHGIRPGTPRIPIETDNQHYADAYIARSRETVSEPSRPIKIGMHTDTPGADFTLAHEIGHYVDLTWNPRESAFSSDAGEFDELMGLIENSDPIKRLKELKAQQRAGSMLDKHLDYMLTPRERFARAYAQWITVKTSTTARRGLGRGLAESQGKGLPYQWRDDDFEEIAAAFDRLFKEAGWLR